MSAFQPTIHVLDQPGFKYNQHPWGDLVCGTKAQLQSIGIAIGKEFPGESGGPKRQMTVFDPRGFKTTVSHFSEDIYHASIRIPGREHPWRRRVEYWTDFAPGVKKRCETFGDEYVGTGEALAAAGLVRLDQLPGQPGMRKACCFILPDGSLPLTERCKGRYEPGAKMIERASKSKSTYRVKVFIAYEERDSRSEEEDRIRLEWEARMLALPRPAPLIDLPDAIGRPLKLKPVLQYRTEGNVIYLERMAPA